MKTQAKIPMIRIHGAFTFDRGAKTRWLLTELGVPYEDRWLNLEAAENETPEYLKINPMGRVPAIEIGDTTLFESGAICAYLADYFQDGGLAPAIHSPDRAKYEQWMYFAASTIDPIQTRIMIIEDIAEGEVRAKKESALLQDFRDALHAMDQTLAKTSFLVANRFTAADICVSYHLYWTTLWPELDVIVLEFPRVGAYLQRMKEMPSAVKAKVFSYEA
jgi:glutathione S-transferase